MKKIIFLITSLSILGVFGYLYFPKLSQENEIPWDTPIIKEPTNFEKKHVQGPKEREALRKEMTYSENGKNYQPGYLQKELRKAKENLTLSNARIVPATMVDRGPSNVPGRSRGLIVLPQDATGKTWIVGAAGGGIWKTTDAGMSWTDKSFDFPSLAVSALDYCKTNPDIIYAGTGEYNGNLSAGILGDGVFKSTDAGETWSQLATTSGSELFQCVSRVIVDPNNPDVVLVSTISNRWKPYVSHILKSVDGGSTWVSVFDAELGEIEQIIASPTDFSKLYASQNGIGILYSSDTGDTWQLISNGMSPDGRIEIGISPVNTNRMYAAAVGFYDPSQEADIYYSDDAGLNWQLILSDDIANAEYNEGVFGLGQGDYDNTVLPHPFKLDEFYVGGVHSVHYVLKEGSITTDPGFLGALEDNTDSFLGLTNFASGQYYDSKIAVGNANNFISIEIRFGAGKSQMAHRFTVPSSGAGGHTGGAGVPDNEYIYNDYVEVPFEAWDIDADPPRQLMVAFRDQQDNGFFDLLNANTEGEANTHAREYLYFNNIDYNASTPSNTMAINGGHVKENLYFLWPFLIEGGTWNPDNLPDSKFVIRWGSTTGGTYTSTIVNHAGGYVESPKNAIVHSDHHNLQAIVVDQNQELFQLVGVTDGGPYASSIAADAGLANDSWHFAGQSLNTTQFTSADKAPGKDAYCGGAVDNGVFRSDDDSNISGISTYSEASYGPGEVVGGDGADAVWHPTNPNIIVGGVNAGIVRSIDGGGTFNRSQAVFEDDSDPSFVVQFSYSASQPDVLYTAGSDGVYRSANFGGLWKKIDLSLNEEWIVNRFLVNVEVSQATPDVVWAGSFYNGGSLFVSTDQGNSFSAVSRPDEDFISGTGFHFGLSSDPHDYKTAYVLYSYADSPKILKTSDLGETWEDISGFAANSTSTGFPDVAVYDLQVMPHDPDMIWVGTEIGIVETTDGGVSWHLLESNMPRVSVWEMRVKEDQIVIATHGRGIWSFDLPVTPEIALLPAIKSYVTGKEEGVYVTTDLNVSFDSLVWYIDGSKNAVFENTSSGVQQFALEYTPGGNNNTRTTDEDFEMFAIGYKGANPFSSAKIQAKFTTFSTAQSEYLSAFSGQNKADFVGNDFSIKTETGFSNGALHSKHSYAVDAQYIYTLTVPVKIEASESFLRYSDVAIVEPGEMNAVFGDETFNDYVVVEGSTDGVNWFALGDGYDASYNAGWLSKYNSKTKGTSEDMVNHEINLLQYFDAGEDALFRFRLYSNSNLQIGWGWAIDNLNIQGEVLGNIKLEPQISVYPNPISDVLNVSVEFGQVEYAEIFSLSGQKIRAISSWNHGQIMLDDLKSGVYFLHVYLDSKYSEIVRIVKL